MVQFIVSDPLKASPPSEARDVRSADLRLQLVSDPFVSASAALYEASGITHMIRWTGRQILSETQLIAKTRPQEE